MGTTKKPAKGRKADYRGAKPEQVARAVLKYRPDGKDGTASLSRTDKPTGRRSVRQP